MKHPRWSSASCHRMKAFIVFAHPEPRSYGSALLGTAVSTLRAKGHEVVVSDLYAMGFDPVASVDDFLEQSVSRDAALRPRAEIRLGAQSFRSRHPGRNRQAALVRLADPSVSALVVFGSRHDEGLDRPYSSTESLTARAGASIPLLGALSYSYVRYDPAGSIAPETYADMTVDAFIAGFTRPAAPSELRNTREPAAAPAPDPRIVSRSTPQPAGAVTVK